MCNRSIGRSAALLALAALAATAPPLGAQAGSVPDTQYRAPSIALVRPTNGVPVPGEKPVIVLRFAAGEPGDPLDLTTFRVAVDGIDRSHGFTVTGTEAWGSLAGTPGARADTALKAGPHEVVVRICSARGACTATTHTVTVLPGADTDSAGGAQEGTSRGQRLIDLLLEAVRRLITP